MFNAFITCTASEIDASGQSHYTCCMSAFVQRHRGCELSSSGQTRRFIIFMCVRTVAFNFVIIFLRVSHLLVSVDSR
jgi:hypothetical protein